MKYGKLVSYHKLERYSARKLWWKFEHVKYIENGCGEKGGHGHKLDPAPSLASEDVSRYSGADERYQAEDLCTMKNKDC